MEVCDLEIKLEKTEEKDAPELLEMQKICFTPHLLLYKDYETSPAVATIEEVLYMIENDNYYKIICDSICVGAINIKKLDDEGGYKLHIINILPEYQGKRIGQTAIRMTEELFPDAKIWELETLEDMPLNRHVYEKLGYHFTGKTEKVNEKLTLVFYKKIMAG